MEGRQRGSAQLLPGSLLRAVSRRKKRRATAAPPAATRLPLHCVTVLKKYCSAVQKKTKKHVYNVQ
jgi:hypothetical protein